MGHFVVLRILEELRKSYLEGHYRVRTERSLVFRRKAKLIAPKSMASRSSFSDYCYYFTTERHSGTRRRLRGIRIEPRACRIAWSNGVGRKDRRGTPWATSYNFPIVTRLNTDLGGSTRETREILSNKGSSGDGILYFAVSYGFCLAEAPKKPERVYEKRSNART